MRKALLALKRTDNSVKTSHNLLFLLSNTNNLVFFHRFSSRKLILEKANNFKHYPKSKIEKFEIFTKIEGDASECES